MKSTSSALISSVKSFGRLGLTALALLASILFAPAQRAGAQTPKKAPLPTIPRPPATEPRQAYDSTELSRVLSPVALYPDPLLAQLLTAATFSGQVAEAAKWSDAHREISGQALTDALAAERVTWDPSVQAMLAFPTVLQMMASDMPWTEEIGDAFQAQRGDVMDAVQHLRTQAQQYGYLRSNDQLEVSSTAPIEILPANPSYIVVPYYDPFVVFAPPPPRFIVSSAIYFGYGVRLGIWFEPFGWGPGGFFWPSHRVAYGYPGWGRPSRYGSGYGRGFYYSPRSATHEGRGRSYNRDLRSGSVGNGRGSRDEMSVGGRRGGDGFNGGNSARGERDGRGRAEQGPSRGGSFSDGRSAGGRRGGASTSRGATRGNGDGRSSSHGGGARSGRSR